MRIPSVFAVALAAVSFTAAPAMATGTVPVNIYPYQTSQNYCPAGLQPVSINGGICCGVANTTISYQQAMRHAGGTRRHTRPARDDCAIGVKGCDR